MAEERDSERSWVGDLAWYTKPPARELVRVVEDRGDRVVVIRGFGGGPILDDRNELPKSELVNIGGADGWIKLWMLDAPRKPREN